MAFCPGFPAPFSVSGDTSGELRHSGSGIADRLKRHIVRIPVSGRNRPGFCGQCRFLRTVVFPDILIGFSETCLLFFFHPSHLRPADSGDSLLRVIIAYSSRGDNRKKQIHENFIINRVPALAMRWKICYTETGDWIVSGQTGTVTPKEDASMNSMDKDNPPFPPDGQGERRSGDPARLDRETAPSHSIVLACMVVFTAVAIPLVNYIEREDTPEVMTFPDAKYNFAEPDYDYDIMKDKDYRARTAL